jgi:hypothetical protein
MLILLAQDLKKYKDLGDSSRKTACHKLNDQSSRSHTIFTIKIRLFTTSMITGQSTSICGKINLVDLAVGISPCVKPSGVSSISPSVKSSSVSSIR